MATRSTNMTPRPACAEPGHAAVAVSYAARRARPREGWGGVPGLSRALRHSGGGAARAGLLPHLRRPLAGPRLVGVGEEPAGVAEGGPVAGRRKPVVPRQVGVEIREAGP